MPWIELSLDTTYEAVDWICTLLASIDYAGDIQITNYTKSGRCDLNGLNNELDNELDNFLENSSDNNSNNHSSIEQPCWEFTIYLYLPNDVGVKVQLEKIVNRLMPLHRTGLTTEIEIATVGEKTFSTGELSPLVHRVGKRFVIINSDAPYEVKEDEVPLRLRTTLSFGSGFHPATMLSLKLLERYVAPQMNVLDLGSGSGILSVAMAKLGAQVLALDNDRTAVEATQDAVDRNGVGQQVTVREGSLGQGSTLGHWMGGDTIDAAPMMNTPITNTPEMFDLIAANILGRVHVTLAPDFQHALRRTGEIGGILITAGFTTDYENEVTHALIEAGFAAIDSERFNEWVALAFCLKG